ncbi:hypothetical protein [Spiroplasma endosymbiont of Labia minor]|uniref:hypothetical protein n=1 Tax=Spiroplasma endosymbiont of Labia minor TaxID=3066305 RepID=UPI0030D0E255
MRVFFSNFLIPFIIWFAISLGIWILYSIFIRYLIQHFNYNGNLKRLEKCIRDLHDFKDLFNNIVLNNKNNFKVKFQCFLRKKIFISKMEIYTDDVFLKNELEELMNKENNFYTLFIEYNKLINDNFYDYNYLISKKNVKNILRNVLENLSYSTNSKKLIRRINYLYLLIWFIFVSSILIYISLFVEEGGLIKQVFYKASQATGIFFTFVLIFTYGIIEFIRYGIYLILFFKKNKIRNQKNKGTQLMSN